MFILFLGCALYKVSIFNLLDSVHPFAFDTRRKQTGFPLAGFSTLGQTIRGRRKTLILPAGALRRKRCDRMLYLNVAGISQENYWVTDVCAMIRDAALFFFLKLRVRLQNFEVSHLSMLMVHKKD